MKKVNWSRTLKMWSPSSGAKRVEERSELNAIANFCKYVGGNMWDDIRLFGTKTMEAKRLLEDLELSKNDVFTLLGEQVLEHQRVYKFMLHQFNDNVTYETPLVSTDYKYLMYAKFIIHGKPQILHSPNKATRVSLDIHPSDQCLGVVYHA